MYDPNAAKDQVNQYTQSRYGRTLNDQEFGLLGGAIGYTGGSVDEAALQKAFGVVDSQFGGATPAPTGGGGSSAPTGASQPQQAPQAAPGAANSPVTPTGQISPAYAGSQVQQPAAPIDPNAAQAHVQGAFRFRHGRDLSPEEMTALQQAVGYVPGQPVTQQMMERAQQLIEDFKGDRGPIANPRWTPGTFEAVPTERKDFGQALEGYQGKFANKTGDPYQFAQFQAPNQGAFDTQLLAALSGALGNSEWSPGRVAAQKEVQKEQALKMEKDLSSQIADSYAGQGRAASGAAGSAQNRLAQETRSEILNAYRDIDENAATNRRQELLATAGALGGALDSQMGRATSGFGSTLQGQTLQADENFRNNFQPMDMALRAALGDVATDMDYNRLDWDKEQFAQNFPELQRQYNISSVLDFIKLMESQRQFNEGLGLDWTKFNWNSIFGGTGF
jgi:hypothetical protein